VLYFLSAHIWKFEFYGNSYYTDERLTKYLEETENIRCGIWKQHIDGALLEENLRLSFPDISWVSVRMEGTSLIISLEEMVKYEKSEDALQFPRYICAAKDGEILSMVTRSGTPKAIVGQEVKAGDLLIDGSVEIMDDSMTVTEIMTVGADGDIWAKVVEPYKKRYDCSGSSKKYERASWKICLSIGGHSFSFGKNPYEDQIIPYHCFSEMWEPLSGICLQINRYRPYEIVPSLETISQAKSRAEEELSDTFREFDEKGVQILENNVKILMYEDRVEADGYFVLIEPIGKASDHFSDGTQIDDIGETHEYNRNDD
ncbi:sporulation protein YqfD, partial [Frisingicoccus sp.]|uniref:sporulation protein YqfD n=1 Tax=Frisingicoccus sp. TaxID=1918627 RepID=UPI00386C4400